MLQKIRSQNRQAVLYARVSSKEQEKEGFSIPAQIKLLERYAQENQLQILQQFTDVETAKRSGRTGFSEMLKFLKKQPPCRIVLVEKTDRLYRNLRDWVVIEELGLDVHFVKEAKIICPGSRSSEKFMHGINVLMAKNYIENLREETLKGMLEKAEQGIWPSFAPLGYMNVDGPNSKRTIVPDPPLAPLIRKIFEWYATGNYSLAEVTKMAQAHGMVFRKSRNPVPKATIHQILHKRIYTGDFDFNGRTYSGKYEPIVSRDLWQRAQEVLQRRLGPRRRQSKHDFAFSGLIACGHCGCSLVGDIKKQRYVYYRCTRNKGDCQEPYVREEVLEAKFTEALKRLKFDEEILTWVQQALRQSHATERQEHEAAIARLKAEHTKLQRRLDAMYEDKLDGVIDEAMFRSKADACRAEQARLAGSIERHQKANQTCIEDSAKLLDLANRSAELFEKQPAREKRKLLNFVIAGAIWKSGELTYTWRPPFDMIAEAQHGHKKLMEVREFERSGKAQVFKFPHSNSVPKLPAIAANSTQVAGSKQVIKNSLMLLCGAGKTEIALSEIWLLR